MILVPISVRFLSTPSARRATDKSATFCADSAISIHALREEGDDGYVSQHPEVDISIHALREEGDLAVLVELIKGRQFLSTPSARRATGRR